MTQPEPPWGSNIVHYFHMMEVSRLSPGAERAVRGYPDFLFWRVEGSCSYASYTSLGSPAHLQNSEDIPPREVTGDQKNSILFSLELTLTHSLTPAPVPCPHPVRRGPLLLLSLCLWTDALLLPWGAEPQVMPSATLNHSVSPSSPSVSNSERVSAGPPPPH